MVRIVVVLLDAFAWAVIIWAASLEACEFDETVRKCVLTEKGGGKNNTHFLSNLGSVCSARIMQYKILKAYNTGRRCNGKIIMAFRQVVRESAPCYPNPSVNIFSVILHKHILTLHLRSRSSTSQHPDCSQSTLISDNLLPVLARSWIFLSQGT